MQANADTQDRTGRLRPSPARCTRCREGLHVGAQRKCSACGSRPDKPTTRRGRRTIGGKRGRNSGKVSQHGKAGG